MSSTTGTIRIGTSGYRYDHWRGLFYPQDIPKRRWFAHYATHFNTVEINNTFYRLPQQQTFEAWRAQAPAGFCYSLKFSRYASHFKRLQDPQEPIHRFLDRAQHLRGGLGPLLLQLPPHWNVDADRLAGFLDAASGTYRWSVEFRDLRWLCGEIYDLLRHHNAALCIHDLIPNHPQQVTADWVYLRFHGTNHGGSYPPQALRAQAKQIARYAADGLDVFAYFNNDAYGYALHNAIDLKHYLKLNCPPTVIP